jgi:hypothetical protein
MAAADLDVMHPSLGAAPMRLGVMVDSMEQPAWIARAIRRVTETGVGQVTLVIRNAAASSAPRRSSRLTTWWHNRRHLLHAAYNRLDHRRYTSSDDPMHPVDVSELFSDVPVLEVVPRQTRFSDWIEQADVDRIRAADTDVLVRFGFRILRGDILLAARYGVWSYHHGDHLRYRGGPPCFWEVMEGNPVTGVVLQRLTSELDDGRILYRSYSATNRFSVTRNRYDVYWKGAEFLTRVLKRLRDEPGAALAGEAGREPSPYGHRLYVAPTNRDMAAGMVRLFGRRASAKVRSTFLTDQWFLLYHRRPDMPDENREPELSPFRFHPIVPPADRFWADPFPVRSDGRDFVLFEELPFATQRGRISILEIGHDGKVGDPMPVLERDYHLSYPFTFSWRGEHFLLPESADVSRIEVYRAVRFPFEWTLETITLEGHSLTDCTIVEHNDRWWMFANAAVPGASFWDELYLYHAPSPLGPWTPHRRNPVVSDVRTARPAGSLFARGRTLYRPSQDCSRGYGGAMNIQIVTRMDERDYEEHTVGRLLPDWQPRLTGVHTVNALGGLTVLDARRTIRKNWGR